MKNEYCCKRYHLFYLILVPSNKEKCKKKNENGSNEENGRGLWKIKRIIYTPPHTVKLLLYAAVATFFFIIFSFFSPYLLGV